MQGNSFCEKFEWQTFDKRCYFPGFYLPVYKIYYEIKKKKKVTPNLGLCRFKKKLEQVNHKVYEIMNL